MKLIRKGYAADHGSTEVDLGKVKFTWDERSQSVKGASTSPVTFGTSANHAYTISLSLAEVGQILDQVSALAIANPVAVSSIFSNKVIQLLRILAACVIPVPQGQAQGPSKTGTPV